MNKDYHYNNNDITVPQTAISVLSDIRRYRRLQQMIGSLWLSDFPFTFNNNHGAILLRFRDVDSVRFSASSTFWPRLVAIQLTVGFIWCFLLVPYSSNTHHFWAMGMGQTDSQMDGPTDRQQRRLMPPTLLVGMTTVLKASLHNWNIYFIGEVLISYSQRPLGPSESTMQSLCYARRTVTFPAIGHCHSLSQRQGSFSPQYRHDLRCSLS